MGVVDPAESPLPRNQRDFDYEMCNGSGVVLTLENYAYSSSNNRTRAPGQDDAVHSPLQKEHTLFLPNGKAMLRELVDPSTPSEVRFRCN